MTNHEAAAPSRRFDKVTKFGVFLAAFTLLVCAAFGGYTSWQVKGISASTHSIVLSHTAELAAVDANTATLKAQVKALKNGDKTLDMILVEAGGDTTFIKSDLNTICVALHVTCEVVS